MDSNSGVIYKFVVFIVLLQSFFWKSCPNTDQRYIICLAVKVSHVLTLSSSELLKLSQYQTFPIPLLSQMVQLFLYLLPVEMNLLWIVEAAC